MNRNVFDAVRDVVEDSVLNGIEEHFEMSDIDDYLADNSADFVEGFVDDQVEELVESINENIKILIDKINLYLEEKAEKEEVGDDE